MTLNNHTKLFVLVKTHVLLCAIAFCFTSKILSQTTVRDSIHEVLLKYEIEGVKKSDSVYIKTMLDLANEQRYFELDSLYILSKEALDLSQQSGYLKGESNAYSNLGIYFSDKGKYHKAINHYKDASKIAEELGDATLKLSIINNIAGEYGYIGDYALALKNYLVGIEIAEKIDNKLMLSIITENIANLYVSQKDFKQAMVFYKKVKSINNEINDPVFMAETASNIASAYAEMGELEHAMFNVNSSIKTFEQEKIIDWLAYAYEIKGKIYLKQKKFKWAMYWYKQSELLHKDLNDERSEIPLLNGIAMANLKMNNDSISEKYVLKAMNLSEKISDLVGIKESAEILYTLKKKNEQFKEALNYHELFQKISDTLTHNENEKGLTMLKTKIEYDQQKEQLIIENKEALAKQWRYLYIVLFLLFVFLAITVLIRKNAKTQKALNKELLSKQTDLENKEEHLKYLNETKNKLFSIIGHDLRGPIGAFQGLIKLFKEGEMTKDEFLGFVPKLKSDIDHIAFTLNNLLSWGQTQMNGAVTKPRNTELEHIVEENIALLSEIANTKNIKLINRVEPNTLTWSDSDQMDIVIRNLVSNALKFTPINGMVTVGAIEKTNHWEIYVRDNGIGMNEETMGKIFSMGETHTTYGTNDEKGTGLGLSLCKEMVEKNNGTIWVNSAVNKGSSFYFTVPKTQKKYKKSA